MEIKSEDASLESTRSRIEGGSGIWDLVTASPNVSKSLKPSVYTLMAFNITTEIN